MSDNASEELSPEELALDDKFTYAFTLNDVLKNHGCVLLNPFENMSEAIAVLTKEIPVTVSEGDAAESTEMTVDSESEKASPEVVKNDSVYPTLLVIIDTALSETSLITKETSNVPTLDGSLSDYGSGTVLSDESKADKLGLSKEGYTKLMNSFKVLIKGSEEDGKDSLPAKLQHLGLPIINVESQKTVKELATIVKRTIGKPRNYAGGQSTIYFADKMEQRTADGQVGSANTPKAEAGNVKENGTQNGQYVSDDRRKEKPFCFFANDDAITLLQLSDELQNSLPSSTSASPLTRYLNQNIMPALLEGMLKVCQDRPHEPIEDLAQFLESKAE